MTGTGTPPSLEHKSAPALDARPGPPGAAATVDPDTGEVTALAAVTGSVDEVKDVIVPGAISRALRRRTPRLCAAHDWARPAGRVLEARELMPGDPRLPRTAPDGTPWPREAGALWFKARFLPTREGQEARAVAQAFGPDSAYSIGYKVTENGAKIRGGTRYITDLDIFEVSAVLHGASRLATLLDVKAAPGTREVKATTGGSRIRTVLSPTKCLICGGPAPGGVDGRSPESGLVCSVCMSEIDNLTDELSPDDVHAEPGSGDLDDGPRRALAEPVTCGLCGEVAGGVVDRLAADSEVICAGCVASVISMGDRLADGADTDPGSDAEYRQALRDEKPLTALPDGTLVRDQPAGRGHGWAPGAGGRARP